MLSDDERDQQGDRADEPDALRDRKRQEAERYRQHRECRQVLELVVPVVGAIEGFSGGRADGGRPRDLEIAHVSRDAQGEGPDGCRQNRTGGSRKTDACSSS